MTPLLLIAVITACETEWTPPIAPVSPDPVVHAAEVKVGLERAQASWEAGRFAEAQREALVVYGVWFEPLEEPLRARDPAGTLELELAFGRLFAHLGKKKKKRGVDVAAEVAALTRAIDAGALTLPRPPPPDPDDLELPGEDEGPVEEARVGEP